MVLYKLPSLVVFGDDTDSPTTAQIEGRGRFRLPPSARDVHAHLEGFQDHALWVTFHVSPVDEASLWTSSLCEKSPSEATIRFQGISRPWWKPGTPASFAFRMGEKTGVSQKVLIDKSNPGEYAVFIETFEM